MHDVQQSSLYSRRVGAVRGQEEIDCEPLVRGAWPSRCRLGGLLARLNGMVSDVEPPDRLAAPRFELSCERMADRTVASLQLTPMRRGDLQIFGKSLIRRTQQPLAGSLRRLEFLEQEVRVLEAKLGNRAHAAMLKQDLAHWQKTAGGSLRRENERKP